MLTSPNIAEVYSIFEGLTQAGRRLFGGTLGGKLVLYAKLDEAGAGIALASSIAGAASLGVDPDAERVKAALRGGVCDFVVNGMDEALRILKNEVRKRQPVSVGLMGEVAECLRAMVERGVQPDLLAPSLDEYQESLHEFVARGVHLLSADLSGDGMRDGSPASAQLSSGEPQKGVWWSLAEAPAKWLPKVDALVVEVLTAGPSTGVAEERLRWLRAGPRYFVRAPEHYVKLASEEANRFIDLVRTQRGSGALPVAVRVRRESGAVAEPALSL